MPKFNYFSVAYFLFFLLLPIVYSPVIVDPVLVTRHLYLSAFLLIIALRIFYEWRKGSLRSDFSFVRSRTPILLILFCLFNVLSIAQALVTSESIYTCSRVLNTVLFFFVTSYLIIERKLKIEYLVLSVIAFCTVTLLIMGYQIFFSERGFVLVNASMANKNLLASALFLCIPFITMSGLMSKAYRILSISLFVLVTTGLWYLQGRAALLAAAVFLTLTFLLALTFLRKKNHNVRGTIAAFLVLLVIGVAGSTVAFQNQQKYARLFNTETVKSRLVLWQNSAEMIKESPVLGVGAGNWKVHVAEYGLDQFERRVRSGSDIYQRPHNDFIWIFSELGIAGFICYLGIFFTVTHRSWGVLKQESDPRKLLIVLACTAGIAGYAVNAMFDFPLERISHQLLFFTILSILFGATHRKTLAMEPSKRFIKLAVASISILIMGSGILVCVHRYSGEQQTSRLQQQRVDKEWANVVELADKAKSTFYELDPVGIPLDWYKGVGLFELGEITQATVAFEKALELTPNSIYALNNLASCQELLGEHDQARVLYLRALTIAPRFEEARLNLSASYFNAKEIQQAFEMIDHVNLECKNPKYSIFLPVILEAKVQQIITQHSDSLIINKIQTAYTNPQQLMQLYMEAKRNKSTLTQGLTRQP